MTLPFEIMKVELDKEQEDIMQKRKYSNYYTVKFRAFQPHDEYEEGDNDIKFVDTEISFKEDIDGALSLTKALLFEPNTKVEIIYTYE